MVAVRDRIKIVPWIEKPYLGSARYGVELDSGIQSP